MAHELEKRVKNCPKYISRPVDWRSQVANWISTMDSNSSKVPEFPINTTFGKDNIKSINSNESPIKNFGIGKSFIIQFKKFTTNKKNRRKYNSFKCRITYTWESYYLSQNTWTYRTIKHKSYCTWKNYWTTRVWCVGWNTARFTTFTANLTNTKDATSILYISI